MHVQLFDGDNDRSWYQIKRRNIKHMLYHTYKLIKLTTIVSQLLI